MTATEVFDLFSKGRTVFGISPKQYEWLISMAKKENICAPYRMGYDLIYLPDSRVVKINRAQEHFAAYGGFVGKRPSASGRFNVKICYHIRFEETGINDFREAYELDWLKKEGHKFEIMKYDLEIYKS